LEKFKSFLTEQEQKPYRLLVIGELGEKGITAKRLQKEASKLGHDIYITSFSGAYIKTENGIRTIHKNDDPNGFELTKDTIVIVRGTPPKDSHMDLLSQLERVGLCLVNSRACISISVDKYRTYLRLLDFGLHQPKTVLIPNQDSVEQAIENLDKKYPIVLKTLRGSKGVGVLFIESERSLNGLTQLIYKTDPDADLLIQEYIKTDYDVRVLVLGGKIIAAMQRDVIAGDFRSNYSQGSTVKNYTLTKLEIEQAILASKAVGGILTAVDFIPSKNRNSKPPYILEVNTSPGTEGIEKATNKNIVKTVLQYFDNPDVRYTVPSECGYYETMSIEPFGNLTAKFDTGNYKYPVLHAENVSTKNKNVTFDLNGITHTTKLLGKYVSVTGGGDDERSLIKLDFTFLGTLYKDVEFGLDDRSRMGTEVLFNRDIMSTMNVIVNPQRKYVVTTKYDPQEEN
jgi:ribosomal protein S6--L-glutamate ligase